MESLFWLSAAFIAYVYVGYPALLAMWASLRARKGRPPRNEERRWRDVPGISIVIAARNEAARLPARINNLLASDYPRDRIQIIVASDGSSDGTAEALAPFKDRVELLQLPEGGKALALNAAVARARNPILVFADARQRFAPDALRLLVYRFADPTVGAVSGELLIDGAHSTIGDGVSAYWSYEKWLRRHEALVGSTIGVTGAIYSMRRDLWRPLPGDTLLDDVLGPMRVVLAGYRVVFEERARAYDQAASDASTEMRRKVRTLAGNFQLLAREPRLLVPVINPVWLQFMSHKLARLFVPYALAALLIASGALAGQSLFYAMLCSAQIVFYGLAIYGGILDRRQRPLAATQDEAFREAA